MAIKPNSENLIPTVIAVLGAIGSIGIAYSQNNERLAKTEQKIESLQVAEQRREQEIKEFKQEIKAELTEIKSDVKILIRAVKVH